MSDEGLVSLSDRVEVLKNHHRRVVDDAAPQLYQAPGRVNLLGEHTDYSGGFCMPAALNFNTLIAATRRDDSLLRLHSLDFDQMAELNLAELKHPPKGHWSAYPAGVVWALQQREVELVGADFSISGDVPPGAGLSSSASVEVAVATALLALAGAEMPKAEVALACQRAENDYVGAPCGIMDQFISAAGVKDNALAIDTRALTFELAPIPAELRLVICNSMVRHSVGGGEYGERRAQVEEAAAALHKINPAIVQLRDADLHALEEAEAKMSREAFLRARHVITDSQRVLDGVAALRGGDQRRFGELMTDAHRSYRDDFAASCDECDLLVRLAISLPGCLGSRLTGGGFGGCTVSLVEAHAAAGFAGELQRLYREATGVTAQVFVCQVEDGAGEIIADRH